MLGTINTRVLAQVRLGRRSGGRRIDAGRQARRQRRLPGPDRRRRPRTQRGAGRGVPPPAGGRGGGLVLPGRLGDATGDKGRPGPVAPPGARRRGRGPPWRGGRAARPRRTLSPRRRALPRRSASRRCWSSSGAACSATGTLPRRGPASRATVTRSRTSTGSCGRATVATRPGQGDPRPRPASGRHRRHTSISTWISPRGLPGPVGVGLPLLVQQLSARRRSGPGESVRRPSRSCARSCPPSGPPSSGPRPPSTPR